MRERKEENQEANTSELLREQKEWKQLAGSSHPKCGPWTRTVGFPRELVRNADCQEAPRLADSESAFSPDTPPLGDV